jgi:hypothetical protein
MVEYYGTNFEIQATSGLNRRRKLDKMSFLGALNNAFEQNHIETSKERLARMERAKEQEKASAATFATNYLRKVILGEGKGGYKVPAIPQATGKLFEAIHGLVPENIGVVKEFLREFPNRLFFQEIPEFCQKSGLGDFVAEVYMTRLLSFPNLSPCWNPSWIKEGESDEDDFFYAVVSLFASMLAIGAGEKDFRRVAEAIYDNYFRKIEKRNDDGRLERLLISVIKKGTYYIPKPKGDFISAAQAAKMKGDDEFVEEGYRSRYTSPQPKNGHRRHSIATVSIGEALESKGTKVPKVRKSRARVQEEETAVA